jgi:hypothetical protein
MRWLRINLKFASPLLSVTMASPSIRHEFADRPPIAIVMKGNRSLKSWPLRVISRGPAASRRPMIRKPSCLIS